MVRVLLDGAARRFVDLRTATKMSSQLLTYHLNALRQRGLVIKDGETYRLQPAINQANLERLVEELTVIGRLAGAEVEDVGGGNPNVIAWNALWVLVDLVQDELGWPPREPDQTSSTRLARVMSR